MTSREKNELLNALDRELTVHRMDFYDQNNSKIVAVDVWKKDDVKYLILNLPEEDEKPSRFSVNYEADYNRVLDELTKLTAENVNLRDMYKELVKRNYTMKIAIKTIEFTTGRKLEL